MAAVEQHDLEGMIVVKRKADPYRRHVSRFKIKDGAYSQADDGQGELLNGDGRKLRVTWGKDEKWGRAKWLNRSLS